MDIFKKLEDKMNELNDRLSSKLGNISGEGYTGYSRTANSQPRRSMSTPPPLPGSMPPPLPGSVPPVEADIYDEVEVDDEVDATDQVVMSTSASTAASASVATAYLSHRMQCLIEAAVSDGVVTESELQVLVRKGQEEGLDADEVIMVTNARLGELKKQTMSKQVAPANSRPTVTRASHRAPIPGKCPHCGAINTPGASKCRECDKPLPYTPPQASASVPPIPPAASVNSVAGSVAELRDNLNKLLEMNAEGTITDRSMELQRIRLIASFTLPVDAKGLEEFLMLAMEQYCEASSYSEEEAWEELVKHAVKRAKTSYPTHRALRMLAGEASEEIL